MTFTLKNPLARTTAALAHLGGARPYERRSCLVELMAAGTKLREEMEALHLAMIEEWDKLDDLKAKLDDPALSTHPKRPAYVASYQQREGALVAEIQRYTECQNTLGAALVAIGKESQ